MRVIFTFLFVVSTFFATAQNVRTNQSESNYYLAETYFRQGEYEKATQIFKELYEKSPFNTTYLNRLISCYQETNQFLVAENLLSTKLKENPTQTYLLVHLGYNYERRQLNELANQYYDKAIASLDLIKSYGSLIGRTFKDYNKLDYAILAYKKAMELNEKANYNFQIAQIYGEKGAFKMMFEAYVDLIDKNESYLNLVQRYAGRYISDDAESETNTLFRKALLRKSISNPKKEWNILLSWLFAQQGDYKKAFIQEKALFAREESDLSEIFRLGKIAYENKSYDAATLCFSFVEKQTALLEEKVDANLFLARILVETKDETTADFFAKLFQEFGKNAITIPIQVEYADFLTFAKNQPSEAKLVLEEALTYAKSKFEKARIKLKLGDVLVYTNNYNKALIYFSQIQTQLKGSDLAQEARFKVAQTSYFKGDFNWAKAQLKVLKGSTTQLIANDAVDLYLKIVDNEPVDSIPSGLKQLAKAELFAYQNRHDEALAVVDQLFKSEDINVAPGEVIYDDALFFKSKILTKLNRFAEALENLEKIVLADNQGFLTDDVYFKMAELYQYNLNDLEKAKEYYQKIIFEQPSSIYLVEARKRFRKLRGDNI